MSSSTAELLFEILNFGLLAAGLGWLLFRPVRAAIAAEEDAHAQRAAALDAREADIQAAQEALDARQAHQEEELQSRANAALEAARAEAGRIRDQAVQDQDHRRDAWEAAEATRQAEAAQAVVEVTAAVVSRAVRALLERAHGPDLDLALARTALDALPASGPGKAEVELAAAPSGEMTALLEARLPDGFSTTVRPELGAGLRIATPGGLVDASALGVSQDAADAVVADLSHQQDPVRD